MVVSYMLCGYVDEQHCMQYHHNYCSVFTVKTELVALREEWVILVADKLKKQWFQGLVSETSCI